MPWIGSKQSGAPFEAARARIELATSLIALGRGDAAEHEASAALSSLLELGADRGGRAGAAAPRRGGAGKRSRDAPGADGARAGCAALGGRGAHEPPDRRTARGERAYGAPARHEHPSQARPSLQDSRGRPRRAGRSARRARAHSRSWLPFARPRMAGPGEVTAVSRRYGQDMEIRSRGSLAEVAALARIERDRRTHVCHLTRSAAELNRDHKTAERAMWALGDYHRFAKRTVWELGPVLVAACRIGPGQRVLDVAAGTGNVAIRAAEAGADVVASDLTPENFDGRPPRGQGAAGSSSSGWRPMPRSCRFETASSTSSPRRSARCSRPSISRWRTSSCACAGPGAPSA